jgi:cell fate regulator YaaT (PSP1 superfamily)
MPVVVGVILREIRDKIYADVGNSKRFNLKLSDKIILETEHGIEAGIVYENMKDMLQGENPIGRVLRKMTDQDEKILAENERINLKAKSVVLQKVSAHKLDMKLTCVKYIFDRSKLFVYYTSKTRVDFRELIKDLGYTLKTRIQMVQIGVRDEAKIFGGIGICGRILCCRNFLSDFNPVTIDMTKEQDLSLNTAKLSGLCDRLMCCIAYESDVYKDMKKGLPKMGADVWTPEGRAKLVAVDCIKEKVTVDFGDKVFKMFAIKQIKNLVD